VIQKAAQTLDFIQHSKVFRTQFTPNLEQVVLFVGTCGNTWLSFVQRTDPQLTYIAELWKLLNVSLFLLHKNIQSQSNSKKVRLPLL
jgi:hypothetical protein